MTQVLWNEIEDEVEDGRVFDCTTAASSANACVVHDISRRLTAEAVVSTVRIISPFTLSLYRGF